MTTTITSFLRIIFLLLLIAIMAPIAWRSIHKEYKQFGIAHNKVASLCIADTIDDISFYTDYLRKQFEDKEIKAILLRIDSPGGYAGTCTALYHEILSLKKEFHKPVVTLTLSVCASGGYEVACASDYIIASPAATVGNIGSYIGYFKLKEFINQWKVEYIAHPAGKYKAIGNPFTATNPDEEQLLQAICDDSYNNFKDNVAHARKLSLNTADNWANGKIFTGKQALALGLVDAIGSEYDAIKKIKELALIEGDIDWVKPPKPGLLEQLTGQRNDTCTTSLLTRLVTESTQKKLLSL